MREPPQPPDAYYVLIENARDVGSYENHVKTLDYCGLSSASTPHTLVSDDNIDFYTVYPVDAPAVECLAVTVHDDDGHHVMLFMHASTCPRTRALIGAYTRTLEALACYGVPDSVAEARIGELRYPRCPSIRVGIPVRTWTPREPGHSDIIIFNDQIV